MWQISDTIRKQNHSSFTILCESYLIQQNIAAYHELLWLYKPLQNWHVKPALIARFMGPTWGPSGADRTPWIFAIWEITLNSWVPLKCGQIKHDIAYINAVTEPTKYTPGLTLTGKLWYVCCEDYEKKMTALQQHDTVLLKWSMIECKDKFLCGEYKDISTINCNHTSWHTVS